MEAVQELGQIRRIESDCKCDVFTPGDKLKPNSARTDTRVSNCRISRFANIYFFAPSFRIRKLHHLVRRLELTNIFHLPQTSTSETGVLFNDASDASARLNTNRDCKQRGCDLEFGIMIMVW